MINSNLSDDQGRSTHTSPSLPYQHSLSLLCFFFLGLSASIPAFDNSFSNSNFPRERFCWNTISLSSLLGRSSGPHYALPIDWMVLDHEATQSGHVKPEHTYHMTHPLEGGVLDIKGQSKSWPVSNTLYKYLNQRPMSNFSEESLRNLINSRQFTFS